MNKREFITLLGGAAAWPLAARAQQAGMPVVGLLHPASPDAVLANRLRGLRQGLKEAGFVEGENVTIEQRWAENQMDRLPELAAALVRRQVSVIAAFGAAAFAARAATTTIPIVFGVPDDPVRQGLVSNLARPGGNLTGINFFVAELTAKRLGLLRELVPGATRIAILVNNPTGPLAEITLRDMETATRAMGMQIKVLNASTSGEINAAFAAIARERPDAIFVGVSPFLIDRRVQLAQLAARPAVPAIYYDRANVEVGGLMSYGIDLRDNWRRIAAYVDKILKGAKAVDLPFEQPTRLELVINLRTAKALDLSIPPSLLARADEVIE